MIHERHLLFSDLHLKAGVEDVCEEVVSGIVEAADTHDCSLISFLGDWWHLRYSIPVGLLNLTRSLVQKMTAGGRHLRVVPGNHDQIDVQGANALDVFSEYPRVEVATDPMSTPDGLYLPYRRDPVQSAQALQAHLAEHPTYPKVAFAHLAITGAMMNDTRACTDGMGVGQASGYDKIICGHYHKRQILDNGRIVYLGSPWQTRADEAGQPKGFAVWASGNLHHYDMQWGPQHHKIDVDDVDAISLEGLDAETRLRITVPEEKDVEAVAKMAADQGLTDVVVEPRLVSAQARTGLGAGAPMLEYAKIYVAEHADGLDPDKLLDVFGEIYS